MTSICDKKVNKYLCRISSFYRSSYRRCSAKEVFLKILQYSQKTHVLESLCGPTSLLFYQKEIPTLIFSCEYCEIFKNTYFEEHLRTTASYFMKNNFYFMKTKSNSSKKKKSMEVYGLSIS